jgi:invasion protein IalB
LTKERLVRSSLFLALSASALVVVVLAVVPAGAQQQRQPPAVAAPASPAPEPAAAPDRTTAQFGDWTVVCAVVAEERRCEVSQVVQDRQTQVGAAVAIGRAARDEPLKLVVRVPLNVMVSHAPRLLLDGAEVASLPFGVCSVLGCFAELDQRNQQLITRLSARTAEQPGRIEWRDMAGNQIGIAVSFRGLGAALAALPR